MARYINPFTDVGFKRIFGQELSKPLLIDFLNNLLKGEKTIVDLRFLDKEQPALFKEDRSLIYDVFCELESGEQIIVEMQNCNQAYFKNRSIYYVSEAIARQGERGVDWQFNIKAVYLIAFLNYRLPDIGDEFRTDAMLMDKKSKAEFSDKIRLVYLQLPLFQKEAEACENDFDRWIYVLKNMETFNRLPWMAKDSVFHRLSEIADVSAMTKEERQKYDYAIRKYRDNLCVYEGVLQTGRAEGRAEGFELAQKQAYKDKLASARSFKTLGLLSNQQIAQALDLPLSEVEKA